MHELSLLAAWHDTDLAAASGAPSAFAGMQPSAYRRSDGLSCVLFLGKNDWHVHELRLENGWKWTDLSMASGAPQPGGFYGCRGTQYRSWGGCPAASVR